MFISTMLCASYAWSSSALSSSSVEEGELLSVGASAPFEEDKNLNQEDIWRERGVEEGWRRGR